MKSSSINYAILDTGSSYLIIGQEDYNNFVDAMPEGVDCTS